MAKQPKAPKLPKAPKPPKPQNVDYTFDLERPYEISIARRDGESQTAPSSEVYYRMRFTQRNENGKEDIARFKDDAARGLNGLEAIATAIHEQIAAERLKDVAAPAEPPLPPEGGVV